jgi:exopolyphosphatase/guanosine-5'-triphosphate,3'-diphosphate pyrophosphatase
MAAEVRNISVIKMNNSDNTNDNSRLVAAIDLGSNSFHMIVARLDEAGTLSVIDKLRETVRLGGGLKENGRLSKESMQRAFDCLEKFGQRIRALPKGDVRVVGTNTLRVAKNAEKFLREAEENLGHPIEVISGREEARLIYLGVAHGRAARTGKRLVVDIGGGSTELIIGEGKESERRESLYTGCVSASMKYFADGVVSQKRMTKAIIDSELVFYPVARYMRAGNWEEAVGCSGTIKSIRNITHAEGWCESGITLDALYRLQNKMVKQGSVEKLNLEGLKPDRGPVLPGGVAILTAVFETLGISHMRGSNQALREGLLYDLVGRLQHQDVREATVQSAMQRWNLDIEHARNVTSTVINLFNQVKEDWNLKGEHGDILVWAAQLHEIGLQISHGAYHKRGAYILTHADLPGFSRPEQSLLAILVLNHRQRFRINPFDDFTEPARLAGIRLCVLLRLAVLFHRGRTDEQVPDVVIKADNNYVELHFPYGWLDQHPLTQADLGNECDYLKDANITLLFD